jgi:hypothetical protein
LESYQQQEQEKHHSKEEEMDAYSIFVHEIRSLLARDYYLRRLKNFFNYIELFPNEILLKNAIPLGFCKKL